LVALGKAYTNLGSVERDSLKATEYLKQGVATLLSADVIDKRQLAVAYNALGTGHQKTDQLEEALTNYTKALDIGLELVNNDENDPSLSTFYCNLGSTFTQQDNVEKGLEYTHKALTISLKIRDPCHPTLGTIYDTLGDCYDKLEKWDRAVEFYQKAVDVYKQPNAQNLRLLVEAYLNMASMYESMNDLAKAIEYYKMALDLQLENLDSDDPDLVTTYWFLASSYQE
jgi:tetratricopeptide (TPR) repeat protein